MEKYKWKYGLGECRGANSCTYSRIGTGNETIENWRDALATANGEIGILQSMDPEEDVLIFQNTKLILDTCGIFSVPDYANILEQQRKNAVTRKDVGIWTKEVKRYQGAHYGVQDYVSVDPRPFHPAAQLRIQNHNFKEGCITAYNRYTNYETGEIGGQWKNSNGYECNTRSFASRSDHMIFTRIDADERQPLDLTIWIDNFLEMSAEDGTMLERGILKVPETKEFVHRDDKGCTLGQAGKYGIFHIGGRQENPETEYSRGGFATAIRIDTDGKLQEESYVRDIQVPMQFLGAGEKEVRKNFESPSIHIRGASYLELTVLIDVQKSGLDSIKDVKELLYSRLEQSLKRKQKEFLKETESAYDQALRGHTKLHRKMFLALKLELCTTQESQMDRRLTNEELIKKQQQSSSINEAFMERLFEQGRFLLICSCGYQVPRMCGIWTGSWLPLFHGNFIFDANLNMQISSMNIGNLKEVGVSYITFILRQLPDWQKNAKHIYGMEGAIKAPTHVDGSGNGQNYHSLPGYPHGYWNASTDWMTMPIMEFYECYGKVRIPLGQDINLKQLEEVLELSGEDTNRIRTEGFDLLRDILHPMTKKLVNFWLQYVDNRFYTDEYDVVHLADGTTIKDGGEGAHYLFTPGYSPENAPGGEGYNGVEALAANTAMDITAAKNSLKMAADIRRYLGMNEVKEEEAFVKRIPEYLYTEDGVLKEWALEGMDENYNHRHISHAYAAWPCHEAKHDFKLQKGIALALDRRTEYNKGDDAMSHGHIHKALAEARLKRETELERTLYTLVNSNYHYTSLLTSHDKYHHSAFCTDHVLSLPGILLESLVYSDSKTIELLPALLPDWVKGKVTGIMARCQVRIDCLEWDMKDKRIRIKAAAQEEKKTICFQIGVPWRESYVKGVCQVPKYGENKEKYIEITMLAGIMAEIEFIL